jgi:endogenous inhibitor of DNA gyrase (YacG/DUF329 family)
MIDREVDGSDSLEVSCATCQASVQNSDSYRGLCSSTR